MAAESDSLSKDSRLGARRTGRANFFPVALFLSFFPFFFSFLFFLSVFSSSWFAARAWARKYDQSLHVLRHVMKIGDREGSVESAGSAESAERVERSQPHAIAPGLPRPRQTRAALRI